VQLARAFRLHLVLIGDPRLDAAFGVRFERMKVDDGWLLRARLTAA